MLHFRMLFDYIYTQNPVGLHVQYKNASFCGYKILFYVRQSTSSEPEQQKLYKAVGLDIHLEKIIKVYKSRRVYNLPELLSLWN